MNPKPSKQEAEGMALAEEYKALVLARTGISADELKCPREKSEMTPCIARDGGTAVAFSSYGAPLCAGCGQSVKVLIATERAKPLQPLPSKRRI